MVILKNVSRRTIKPEALLRKLFEIIKKFFKFKRNKNDIRETYEKK